MFNVFKSKKEKPKEDEQKEEVKETSKSEKEEEADKKKQKSKKEKEYPEIDLVFLMDCTASMASYIESAKSCIIKIAEQVKSSEKADIRFSYIAYRDHKDAFVTKVHDFTSSMPTMRKYISQYDADGGGDGPEAVTPALNDALKLPYRKEAVKIVVIIADAPPHGVTKGDDDWYPQGDPDGLDPIKIVRTMAEQGIVLYVVACEPSLSDYPFAHDFMAGLAKITEGKYLPLTSAHLLPDVIIGGAKEEIALQKLEEEAAKEMEKLKKENPNAKEEDLEAKLVKSWEKEGKKINVSEVDDIYGSNYNYENVNNMVNWNDMNAYQNNVKPLEQPKLKTFNNDSYGLEVNDNKNNNNNLSGLNDVNNSSQSHNFSSKSIDHSHVKKVLNRSKMKK